MANEVKRMNYYNGLFLKEEDFITEQDYNIRMRRLMNWYLNRAYGVLEGLNVEPVEGSKKYRITPGIALSDAGEGIWHGAEIVLTSYKEEDFSANSPGEYYVTISYDEVKGDRDESKGTEEIHWIEVPRIEVKAESPGNPEREIVLAKITVPVGEWTSKVEYVNTGERKNIGPALRSINGRVGIGTSEPSENLEVSGAVKATVFLGDGSKLSGLKLPKWVDVEGGIVYNKGNVGIGVSFPSQKLEVAGGVKAAGFEGDGSKLTGIAAGKWSDVTGGIAYNKGNVGIGNTTPKNKLDILGDLAFSENKHRSGKIRLWQEADNGDEFVSHGIGTEPFHNIYGAGKKYPKSIGHKFYTGNGELVAQIGFGGEGKPQNRLNSYFEGNIGLGTADPSQRLEIVGNIKISGGVIQEDWITPSLMNGWVRYSDEQYNPPGYFKDKNGVVHLRGLIRNGGFGQPAFNLPDGYRPAFHEIYAVLSADKIGRCDILANGNVIPGNGDLRWFSLDGITFRAKPRFIIIPPPIITN